MRLPAVLLLTLAFALPAGTAAAQEAPRCDAPRIDSFLHSPDPLRTGTPEEITVRVQGASSVAIDWPDGTRSVDDVRRDYVSFTHTFGRPLPQRIVAHATARCGASTSAAATLDIRAPCATTRDATVHATDCDAERGTLAIFQRGLATPATWVSAPCRDTIDPLEVVRPEPVARAAACAEPPDPMPVAGRLPVRENRMLMLRLGVAAALNVRVALGNARRPTTPWVHASRVRGSRRLFRIRVGTIRRSTRVWVLVRLPADSERFVAGVRAAQSS